MPILQDPEHVLPEHQRRLTAAEVIMLLLYPVIFLVGLIVGLVIGLKQPVATSNITNTTNTTPATTNTSIIPNANGTVVINSLNTSNGNTNDTNATNSNVNAANTNVTNTANANTGNTNSATNTANTNTLNTNTVIGGGEYLQLNSSVIAAVDAQREQAKQTQVDQTASVTDMLRQTDIINLKYDLKTYYLLHHAYPSTSGTQYKLDRSEKDPLLAAMKIFYGPSYNERIDPESPSYYYGYTSDGTTFQLTAYMTSKSKAFILHDTP